MAVHWKPLPDGVKIPEADYTGRTGRQPQKPAGSGKPKCPHCHYRIRGSEDEHEKGQHHQHPKVVK